MISFLQTVKNSPNLSMKIKGTKLSNLTSLTTLNKQSPPFGHFVAYVEILFSSMFISALLVVSYLIGTAKKDFPITVDWMTNSLQSS